MIEEAKNKSFYKEVQLARLRWVTFLLLVLVATIVLMMRKPVENIVPKIIHTTENMFDKVHHFIEKDLKWNPIKIETHLQNVLDQLKAKESPFFDPPLMNDTRFEIDKYRD